MFPFSLTSFRRVFGYLLCLSLMLGACSQALSKNTAQPKLPRYCASAETARAHLQRLFPKRKIVKYELQLPGKDGLLFTGGCHNFIGSNGERWCYDLTSGDLYCYEDTARDKDMMAFRSHCTKEELRQLVEQNRAKAIAWAEQYLRVWLPEWQKHQLVALCSPPTDTDVFFQERLPCGAVNLGYNAIVDWDPRTGRPLGVQMCYRYASPRIPLVTHISREAAAKLAEDAVKRLPGVRWHMRIDPYDSVWKDCGLAFLLETDGLGIQRLVYGFWFAFWRGNASMTPTRYEA
ncbi:MAG TPA: hypothetical protein VHR86_07150, partial [Armatimonadota bacterium]|nr:hypothetical protein [Armatimonadota bacterium]